MQERMSPRLVSDNPLYGLALEEAIELYFCYEPSDPLVVLALAIAERTGHALNARKALLAINRGLVRGGEDSIYRVQEHTVDLGERRCSCGARNGRYPRCWHYVAAVLFRSREEAASSPGPEVRVRLEVDDEG